MTVIRHTIDLAQTFHLSDDRIVKCPADEPGVYPPTVPVVREHLPLDAPLGAYLTTPALGIADRVHDCDNVTYEWWFDDEANPAEPLYPDWRLDPKLDRLVLAALYIEP